MKRHEVRAHPSKDLLGQEDQLAFKLAKVALDPVPLEGEVVEMLINRVIDNAAVAMAAINRRPVANARSQALCFPRQHKGSTLFGLPPSQAQVAPQWAGWANSVAVRELDFHDTFLAADYSHPADNIPHLLAVAQAKGRTGQDLLRAMASSYEIQVALTKGICLHEWKKDHVAHLGVSVAAGLGALLELSPQELFQAIGQSLHVTISTRQSRKGEISSWKAYAPAFAGKMAIEATDRAMRGEAAPSPIYEGEDSVVAWMLGGKQARYWVELPDEGQSKRAVLEPYTKEHSAEYQAQALIDLAFEMKGKIEDLESIESIVIETAHHTHNVIGTGARDPQKMDPMAGRETLDHSIMYIFAVALQDGRWHHRDSYLPQRAQREDTVRLWHKISTREDPRWTARYHEPDPKVKALGGRVIITLSNGQKIQEEKAFARAHPLGTAPFGRKEYIQKFQTLTEGAISEEESKRFLDQVQNLPKLSGADLKELNPRALDVVGRQRDDRGIF